MRIDIEGLSFIYPDNTKAISDITCSFSQKKIAILGANGSGKSTLLQHLNGIHVPQSGTVKIAGEPITKQTAPIIREKVGLVFDQPDQQLFAPTVFEDVAFGPRNKGLPEEEVMQIVEQILEVLGISHLKEKAPYDLSLGQKKKVAIAGVLAMEPELLLFDEPFSGLDPRALTDILQLLDQLTASGHMIILTTHDVDFAYSWAEECCILKGGKLLYQGDTAILENKEMMREAGLCTPLLFSLFQDTDYRPRTVEQGRYILSTYLNKQKHKARE
ncbi:cobalt/nickel transport system ATP-binding protein [Caldalkalibacillus uzonensis]|uniref:Cobalt/nickel transport system ATP-binding protein n=1 Tax=Caldalkalibacillus uzonensis TaxID=353224 RepID=A0ABU0CUL9_9BACI|nr:ATP-binding cassette domain-containing protein [Caldalkalibacillus uzonensis]MDQ0340117.1 cobalt/nickel transport system ATP-binding protein [Caldalkalibacillus uzonensis]